MSHRPTIKPQSKSKTHPLITVNTGHLENIWMNNARSTHLNPAHPFTEPTTLAFTIETLHVRPNARLHFRIIFIAIPDFDFGAVQSFKKSVEGAKKILKTYFRQHYHSLILMKNKMITFIHFFIAINSTGKSYLKRRFKVF